MSLPSAAALAATPDPSPTDATVAATLSAAPAANGILRPGDPLSVVVTLSAGSSTSTTTPVALSIGTASIVDDASLDRWLGGDASGQTLQQVATGTVDATASGAQNSITLTVAATDPTLAGRGAGIYPVLVSAAGLTAPSVVVVPSDGPTTPIALVVPITAAPLTRGVLTGNELAELTAVDGALSAQLDAVDGTAATLAIDPAIPAAIRVLGSAAPPTAVAWLQRLLALPNDRFALQFGDADIAAQLQAGLSAPLEPTSLQSYMSEADFTGSSPAVSAASSAEPTPTTSPGQPTYPTLTALLDVGATTSNVFWPATGSAGPVASLGARGTVEEPTRVLMASTSIAGGARVAPAAVAGVSTPVYDAEVSRVLAAAAGQNDATRRSASLAAAQAYLAVARGAAGDQPVLAVLDRGTDRSRVSLRATLGLLSSAPGFATSTLAEISSRPASEISLTAPSVDSTRASEVGELLSDEQSVDRFATILDQPDLLTGRERAEMLQVISVSWTGDAARRAVADHRAGTQTTLDSVGILSSDFRLVSSSAPLRPWVRNDLPWPVTVVLDVSPNDARLRVQDRTTVQAQAAANTRVEVPVEARIANGEVSVDLQLYSPTDQPVGAPQRVDVEVRAEWESIGLIVIVGLVVGFLGIGVVRTIARRRRARTDEESTPTRDADTPVDGLGVKGPDDDGRSPAESADENVPAPDEQEIRP
jgi:hypothetical protein